MGDENFLKAFVLRSNRLTLDPAGMVEPDAVEGFFSRNREFHAPWDPIRPESYYLHDSIQAMLCSQQEQIQQSKAYYWYVRTNENSDVIGFIGLTNIVYGAFLSCFLGYKMDGRCNGRGYMTEALSCVIAFAFEHCKLHRIEANVMPRNLASIRVLEKLGFVNEGFSESYLKIAGKWEGHCHFALLNDCV